MKKPIRIFALPSHQTVDRTSGVDMVRIIQPMQHLNKLPGFKVDIFDIHKDVTRMDWLTVAKEHDIIYLNYIGNAWAFAAMGAMARKYGRKIIFDLDDSLWNIMKDNSAYKVYHKGSEALNNYTSMCNEVDYMTTTNLYLKHVITPLLLTIHARRMTKLRYSPTILISNYIITDQSLKMMEIYGCCILDVLMTKLKF